MKSPCKVGGALRAYPDYKPSGVEWLGDVPAHWCIERAKWLFRKMDRVIRENDEVVTCFRDGGVTLRKNRRTQGFTESLKEIGYQGIRRGDLVIHAMDAFAGAIGVADSDGKGTPVYSVCKPNARANAWFYAYLLREMARNEWIQALQKGIRERSSDFRYTTFGSQLVPAPPLAEQKAIVRYLDYVGGRIGRYIRGKEKLVALLEEEKQAVIQQAVTRGLDANVRLKPSGVEWLGDVPAHWEVRRMRTVVFIRNGATPSTNNEAYWNGDILWITPEDLGAMKGRRITSSGRRITRAGYESCGASLVSPNSIAISTRAPIGHLGILGLAGCVNQGCKLLVPKGSIRSDFLYHVLETARPELQSRGHGTTFMELSRLKLGNFPLPAPPLVEQVAIAAYLDRETARIDAAAARARRQIELMREYRERLIADVVTGKLDVREASTRLPNGGDTLIRLEQGS